MPCYLPLDAYHAPGGISFKRQDSFGTHIQLPCGRCLGCKLQHAKEWALRCYHESLTTENESMFITLTYDQDHIPNDGMLDHEHFQKFIRKLRKKTNRKLRYFMCGEYGEQTARPHYHAIIFGFRPLDLKLVNIRNGSRNYTSEFMSKMWPRGGHEIGFVSYKNAGYVARYTLKKQKEIIDMETGESLENVFKPYIAMSRKPGLGEKYFKENMGDFYPHDYAITPDSRKTPVPKYYRKLLERENPKLASQLKTLRVEKARANPDNSPDRMEVKHYVQIKKAERLKREL